MTEEFKSLSELANFSEEIQSHGGRPAHAPTEQTKALVTLMIGMGATLEDVAAVIGIHRNTLSLRYREQIDKAPALMDYHFYTAMYKAIQKQKPEAMKLYADRRAKSFKPDPPVDVTKLPPVTIVMNYVDPTPRIADGKTIDNEPKP